MSQERAFLQQLQANPADDATRLIYADWLEDQDDPRGRYLRLEVELAALSEQDSRYQTLEEELQGLRGSIEPEWLEAAGNRYDLVLLAYPPHSKIPVIKAIRELTLCGLKEAKDVSERLPAVVLRGVSRPRAEEASEHLRYSGGNTICEAAVRPSRPHVPGADTGPIAVVLDGLADPARKISVIKVVRELTHLENDVESWHSIGQLLADRGELEQAVEPFRQIFLHARQVPAGPPRDLTRAASSH